MVWLRAVHILAGIFWVGSTMFIAGFLLPAARGAGAEGGRFLERVMRRQRMGLALGLTMLLTVASGFALYGRLASGLGRGWVMSRPGLALATGALAAILAVVIGIAVNGPAGAQLSQVRARVAARGEPPSPADAALLEHLGSRITRATIATAALLGVAAVAMATARYL